MAKKKSDTNLTFEEFISRNYGKDVLVKASDFTEKSRKILKTILSLDIALSGGIPEGTVCLFSGKAKAGKTTLTLEILRNAILADKKAFYVDIERRCKKALLDTISDLDTEKLQFIQGSFSAEQWFNIIERTIKDNPGCVIVVDSLAQLSTLSELSEAVGDNKDMAGVPKLVSSFFRKNAQVIDDNNVILVFISQLQTNREPHGKKWIEKGGQAIQYACSVWLNVDYTKAWDKDSDTNAPAGHDIFLKVVSSALGCPFLPCSLPLRYGKGIDKHRDLAIQCENLGLIIKSGSWYEIPAFDKKVQGLDGISDLFRESPEIAQKLEEEVRKTVIPNANQTSERENEKAKPKELQTTG